MTIAGIGKQTHKGLGPLFLEKAKRKRVSGDVIGATNETVRAVTMVFVASVLVL